MTKDSNSKKPNSKDSNTKKDEPSPAAKLGRRAKDLADETGKAASLIVHDAAEEITKKASSIVRDVAHQPADALAAGLLPLPRAHLRDPRRARSFATSPTTSRRRPPMSRRSPARRRSSVRGPKSSLLISQHQQNGRIETMVDTPTISTA